MPISETCLNCGKDRDKVDFAKYRKKLTCIIHGLSLTTSQAKGIVYYYCSKCKGLKYLREDQVGDSEPPYPYRKREVGEVPKLSTFSWDRNKYCSRKCAYYHMKKERKAVLHKDREKRDYLRVTMRNRIKRFVKTKKGVYQYGDKMLLLKTYKEPLTPIPPERGVGLYGTLALEQSTGLVQCHLCGRVMDNLNFHIIKKHGSTVAAYKEEFKLARTTALVSEGLRQKVKAKTLEWIKTLTPEQKQEYRQNLLENRKKRSNFQPKKSLESLNKDDHCPEQTLNHIEKAARKLGHIPTKSEFIEVEGSQEYVHLAYKIYGSWTKAVKMCHFGNLKEKEKEETTKRRYTDEELLEYLRMYAEENRVVPTISDWKRGLLPSYDVYPRRFGSIENARQLAGVYQIVEPSKTLLTRSRHYRQTTP